MEVQGGADAADQQHFQWTEFYVALGEKLLGYANDRGPLIQTIAEMAKETGNLGYLQDQFSDGSTGLLHDICPFTTMGAFNRSESYATRQNVAGELARRLGVNLEAPAGFEGIPTLDNRNSWFFRFAKDRNEGDIDALWRVFLAAKELADHDQPKARAKFRQAYDEAIHVSGVKWNLSFGLFWAHPWSFPSFSTKARNYIPQHLGIEIQASCPDAEAYLGLRDRLLSRYREKDFPVHSFPATSLAAWDPSYRESSKDTEMSIAQIHGREHEPAQAERSDAANPCHAYSMDDLFRDGCFQDRSEVEQLLERLRDKKNLILQGPPGTGKTWLAKRLAYLLIGEIANARVRIVQFHPRMSYEDFVRGWRPTATGKLSLVDGVFLQAVHAAEKDSSPYVVVIEEINRGNPAQIFGELLTLLEADKRDRYELELTYPDADGNASQVRIPGNLYVIGTMNLADRSLALLDFALRRRFAFGKLRPRLDERWRDWVINKCGVEAPLADEIEHRVKALNEQIAADTGLGEQYEIGHSYVTPTRRLEPGTAKEWFFQVVETEIEPLLEEYWFNSPDQLRSATGGLKQRW